MLSEKRKVAILEQYVEREATSTDYTFALKTRERELRAQDFVTQEKKKRGVSQIERHLSFLLCLRKRIFLPFDTLLLSRE